MCEVNGVIIIGELDTERQCEVVALSLLLHRVLVVADVLARPYPALSELARVHIAVHERPHPVVVQRVRLQQVNDVEAVRPPRHRVRHAEVVPLSEPARVVVRLQDQVVLELVDLDGPAQVARFETRLEHQRVVVFEGGLVVRSEVLVIVARVRVVCVFVQLGRFVLNVSCLLVRLVAAARILSLWRRVNAVIHHSVHEVLLVGDAFSFSAEALLKDVDLWGVEGLQVFGVENVVRTVFHQISARSSTRRR